MAIFKRIEIWILLLLLVGGALYAVFLGSAGRKGEGRLDVAEESARSRIRIEGMELTRDYGNGKLSLDIEYDNTGGGELSAAPPDVRLLTADGEAVDLFYLAGDFPESVPAGARARMTLRYWLRPEHFAQALELEIRGETIPVKSADAFDLESMANQETRKLDGTDW